MRAVIKILDINQSEQHQEDHNVNNNRIVVITKPLSKAMLDREVNSTIASSIRGIKLIFSRFVEDYMYKINLTIIMPPNYWIRLEANHIPNKKIINFCKQLASKVTLVEINSVNDWELYARGLREAEELFEAEKYKRLENMIKEATAVKEYA